MSSDRPSPDLWGLLLAASGAFSIANGVWMLLDPGHWYEHLPAGVPDTGPLNAHFVRDIGCAFVAVGAALVAAWRRPAWRAPLTATAAAFFVMHALLHVHDTARGLLEADHWWLDAPGVYAPALLLAYAAHRFNTRPHDPRPTGAGVQEGSPK
ncbi:MAG: DUF4345 family protein [Myxococcota bacterium]